MSTKEELAEAKNRIRLFLRTNSSAIGSDVVDGAMDSLNASFRATHKLAEGLDDGKKEALFSNVVYVYNEALQIFRAALEDKNKLQIVGKVQEAITTITDATTVLLQKYEEERDRNSGKINFSAAGVEVTDLLKAIGLTSEAEAVSAAVDGAIKASEKLTPEKASYVFAQGAKTLIGSTTNIDAAHHSSSDRFSRLSIIKEIVEIGVRDLKELPDFANRLNIGGDKGKAR